MQGAGCRVQGAGCRVQGAGCRMQGEGSSAILSICRQISSARVSSSSSLLLSSLEFSDPKVYAPGIRAPGETAAHFCEVGLDAAHSLLIALFAWRGTTRAEDAQGIPTQSHVSPSILVYEDKKVSFPPYSDLERRKRGERHLKTRVRAQGWKMQRRLSKSSGSGTLSNQRYDWV